MDNIKTDYQYIIDEIQLLIKKKKEEIIKLQLTKTKLKLQTSRYQNIFDKSNISMWEENPSEVYKILEALPCSTGIELEKYLNIHTETIVQLVTQLKIVKINSYTFSLFDALNESDFLKTLSSGKILTQETFPGFISIFSAMIDNKSNCQAEINTYTLKGDKLTLLMTAYIPGRGNGNILVSMVDITERKINETNQLNNLKLAKVQQQRTEVFQSILFSLNSSLNKNEILSLILSEVNKLIPYSCANIRLLENGYLKTAVSFGYEKYDAENFINNSSLKIEQLGDAKWMLERGEINIIPDTRKYSKWTVFPETSYILGYIGIPIKWKNKTLGLLSLESDTTNTFFQEDAIKLKPFATAVAVALHSSHLFELAKNEVLKRETTEKSIIKSIKEKEILLREIHHRVKNNLTLIMSLINLQSSMVNDSINPLIFEDLKQRVYTISLVHERLYNSNNLSSVDLKSYLIDLTESIRSSPIFKEGIEFKIKIEDSIKIEADTLVPLALLLNELLINSVKYAFPDKPGIISITVSNKDSNHKIIFKDNGVGIPENKEPSQTQIGLLLVESLAAQINGTVNFRNEGGAVTTIIFPQK